MYQKRKKDPQFAQLWDLAIEHGIDKLEEHVMKRAKARGGDRVALWLLERLRPEKYGQRLRLGNMDGSPVAPTVVAPTVIFVQPEKEPHPMKQLPPAIEVNGKNGEER